MERVVLMPTGSLNLTGLRAEVLFYKGLLDKLDIEADMLAMGKYSPVWSPTCGTACLMPFVSR